MKDHIDAEKIFGKAIGQIIHDIRNPLNTIIGFSSILQIDETINEEIKGYLKKIYHSGMTIENLLSNIDYFMMDNIETNDIEFEALEAVRNHLTRQLEIISEKDINIEYLSGEEINIKLSMEIFNKIFDNLLQFSIKGMRTVEEKVIQMFFKRSGNNIIMIYSDASPPVFIENDYFNFEEALISKRGLGVMFIKRYAQIYNGTIEYKYGKKWQVDVGQYSQNIKNNHGFIISLPVCS
jgi:two-component system, OmpR family, sensor kinase